MQRTHAWEWPRDAIESITTRPVQQMCSCRSKLRLFAKCLCFVHCDTGGLLHHLARSWPQRTSRAKTAIKTVRGKLVCILSTTGCAQTSPARGRNQNQNHFLSVCGGWGVWDQDHHQISRRNHWSPTLPTSRPQERSPQELRGVYFKRRSGYGEHLTILEENVEKDDADLVRHCDIGIQQDGNNQPHGILDLLPLGVDAHSQILGEGRKNSSEVTVNSIYSKFKKQEIFVALCKNYCQNYWSVPVLNNQQWTYLCATF